MSEESAFLDTLRANPADALRRAVYADWLADHDRFVDEAVQRVICSPADDVARLRYADCCERATSGMLGPPLAEFVRAQVEIAAIRASGEADPKRGVSSKGGELTYVTPEKFHRLRERELQEREFLRECSLDWFGAMEWCDEWHGIGVVRNGDGSTNHGGWCNPAPAIASEGDSQYILADFTRGFVEKVTTTAHNFLAHASDLLLRHPVRRVRLGTLPGVEWGPLLRGAYDERECRLLGGTREKPEHATKWVRVPYLTNATAAHDRIIAAVIEACWPGVTFDLPTDDR